MKTLFPRGSAADRIGPRLSFCLSAIGLAVVATAGCDATGVGGAASKPAEKQSRDVGEQVDAVMKDFKNE